MISLPNTIFITKYIQENYKDLTLSENTIK